MGLAFPLAAATAGRGALSNGKLGSLIITVASKACGGVSRPRMRQADNRNGAAGGWMGAPPPGVPTLGNRSATGLTFSQSVGGLSQPSTPLDMKSVRVFDVLLSQLLTWEIGGDSEFPALGGQTQSNPAQAWSRINTQSPSQNRGLSQQQHPQQPPTSQQPQHLQSQQQHDGFPGAQKDIFAGIDDYRIGSVGVSGGGGGQPQGQNQGGQMQPQGVMEDFPALPRTQPGSLGALEERGLSGLGQRQGMSSRILPHLDGMMGHQAPMASSDVEKKVSSSRRSKNTGQNAGK